MDTMSSDDELPEDEEEILVYVEFDGIIADNAFANDQLRLDMLAIDTEHPIMQINGRFYEGTYEDAVGTYMLFTRNEDSTSSDPVFDVPVTLKYFGKTRKVLKMQRIFIENRAEVLGESDHSQCLPNLDAIKDAGVPVKYQQEALCFWKNLRDYRMNALNSYLEKQRIREERKSKGLAIDSESDDDHPFTTYAAEELDDSTENISAKLGSPSRNYSEKLMDPEDIRPECTSGESTFAKTDETEEHDTNMDADVIDKSVETKVLQKTSATKTKKAKSGYTAIRIKSKEALTGVSKKDSSEEERKNDTEESNINDKQDSSNQETDDIVQNSQKDDLQDSEEMDTDPLSTDSPKETKQLKREAKMQEILNKLKALAHEAMNSEPFE